MSAAASSQEDDQLSIPSFRLASPLPVYPSRRFAKSFSLKEPSFPDFPEDFIPGRLSNPSLHAPSSSPLSSPLHPLLTTPKIIPTASDVLYRCVSSLLRRDGQVLSMTVSGGLLYTGSEGNAIRAWKLPEFVEWDRLRTRANGAVSMAAANDTVFAAYADGRIRAWRRTWEHGTLRHVRLSGVGSGLGGYVRGYIAGKDRMTKHGGLVTSLAINSADDILYSASADKTVKVWRLPDFKCVETFQAHSEPINDMLVADDGVVFTASDDATVRAWRRNLYGGDRPHILTVTLPAKNSPVKALTLTPDGQVLYGGCTDGYIHYWFKGWFTGQLQYGGSLQGHTHAILCMASVENYVVSGSADSTSRIWARDPQDGQRHTCLAILVGHRGPVRCVASYTSQSGEDTEEDGCMICTGSLDGVLKLWKVTSAKPDRLRKAPVMPR
ncbi:hypothetical protein MLD38_030212 [Melastoma candidum]|uniref:Uncharacterized protein n=1 Tax=Melastoma candidum TaxID=119954 RepID=A0ACB9MR87_9MYRT|nr:hypothetical protein MLD38_030212 [Melastoma candidum]